MRSELDRFCEDHNITCTSVYGGNYQPIPDGFMPGTHPYRVTLKRDARIDGERIRRQISADFFMGPALCEEPTPGDVLSSLLLDASSAENARDFEDFCAEFGYDTDSRRAERIYRACEAMAPKVRAFLGELYDDAIDCEH